MKFHSYPCGFLVPFLDAWHMSKGTYGQFHTRSTQCYAQAARLYEGGEEFNCMVEYSILFAWLKIMTFVTFVQRCSPLVPLSILICNFYTKRTSWKIKHSVLSYGVKKWRFFSQKNTCEYKLIKSLLIFEYFVILQIISCFKANQ